MECGYSTNQVMLKLANISNLVTYQTKSNSIETFSDVDLLINGEFIEEIGISLDDSQQTIDCSGRLVTPGFVDCHTHSVFYNGREEEYSKRLSGISYQDIAQEGGGINASIQGVRKASENELLDKVSKRMKRFIKLGTTTVESKSGYGLDTESELKSLRVLDKLNQYLPIDIVPTFLGAHAFPPEYSDNHNGYVELLCNEMIPEVGKQGIAKYCDVFCENGYFTVNQSKQILETAKNYGMIPRIHADEFKDSGAAKLAGDRYLWHSPGAMTDHSDFGTTGFNAKPGIVG